MQIHSFAAALDVVSQNPKMMNVEIQVDIAGGEIRVIRSWLL